MSESGYRRECCKKHREVFLRQEGYGLVSQAVVESEVCLIVFIRR